MPNPSRTIPTTTHKPETGDASEPAEPIRQTQTKQNIQSKTTSTIKNKICILYSDNTHPSVLLQNWIATTLSWNKKIKLTKCILLRVCPVCITLLQSPRRLCSVFSLYNSTTIFSNSYISHLSVFLPHRVGIKVRKLHGHLCAEVVNSDHVIRSSSGQKHPTWGQRSELHS